jgi:hypothetical protein
MLCEMERMVSMIKYNSMDGVPTGVMNFTLKFISTAKPVISFNG